jgi:peptidoglycan/xylan/chitin deacetylase (PgdA/CDA1 family)
MELPFFFSKMRLTSLLTLIATSTAMLHAQTATGASGVQPITPRSTEEEIRQIAALARAGRKLTPKAWPNGARVAVCFSFDIDNESLSRSRPLPVPMSNGEYGATTGLPRILEMLGRQQIPASFFIPAMSLMLHPEMVQAIQRYKGHEIGVHGWVHESLSGLPNAADEEALLKQSIDYLTKAIGKRPAGYRAPSWVFSPNTLGQIASAGFSYDSSMMAMDQPYELMTDGNPTGLVELPISWILDDFPYYGENADGHLPAPEAVYQIYKDEFDVAWNEGTLYVLTAHPHISGHGSRVAQLDRLITYMKSREGVWFATLEQIATYVREQSAAAETKKPR